jgi:hypothetical protein
LTSSNLAESLDIRDSAARRKVVAVLSRIRRCKGRAAAVSMHTIAEETGIEPRDIQAFVKFLVEERHVPIGTGTAKPFGYFWITSDAERRAVRNQFMRRGLSNLTHARAYDNQRLVGPIVGQLELAIKEGEPKP